MNKELMKNLSIFGYSHEMSTAIKTNESIVAKIRANSQGFRQLCETYNLEFVGVANNNELNFGKKVPQESPYGPTISGEDILTFFEAIENIIETVSNWKIPGAEPTKGKKAVAKQKPLVDVVDEDEEPSGFAIVVLPWNLIFTDDGSDEEKSSEKV